MTLTQRIEAAILSYASDRLPEEAIKIEPSNHHHFLDTCFVEDDEIDITALAEAIAKGIEK